MRRYVFFSPFPPHRNEGYREAIIERDRTGVNGMVGMVWRLFARFFRDLMYTHNVAWLRERRRGNDCRILIFFIRWIRADSTPWNWYLCRLQQRHEILQPSIYNVQSLLSCDFRKIQIASPCHSTTTRRANKKNSLVALNFSEMCKRRLFDADWALVRHHWNACEEFSHLNFYTELSNARRWWFAMSFHHFIDTWKCWSCCDEGKKRRWNFHFLQLAEPAQGKACGSKAEQWETLLNCRHQQLLLLKCSNRINILWLSIWALSHVLHMRTGVDIYWSEIKTENWKL